MYESKIQVLAVQDLPGHELLGYMLGLVYNYRT